MVVRGTMWYNYPCSYGTLYQFDVEKAFPNADLDGEEIYMHTPTEVAERLGILTRSYLRLLKALYGLKQASRAWYKTVAELLLASDYVLRSKLDNCMFYQHRHDTRLWIVIHVDDFALAATTMEQVNEFADKLKSKFTIKLKALDKFLGLEVIYNREDRYLYFHLRTYILQQVAKFEQILGKAFTVSHSPGDPNIKMHKRLDSEPRANGELYRNIVGVEMYVSTAGRIDTEYSANRLSRYMQDPSDIHFEQAIKLLAYLKSYPNKAIRYYVSSNPSRNQGHFAMVDSDHAGCPDTRRSTTGFIEYYANGPIGWATRLQPSASGGGPTESEYKAVYSCGTETVHKRQLLIEIGLPQTEPTTIFEDNEATILLSYGNTGTQKIKSVDIKYHVIKDWVADHLIKLVGIKSADNDSDMMTKHLAPTPHHKCNNRVMYDIPPEL